MPRALEEGKSSYRGRSHSLRAKHGEKSADAIVLCSNEPYSDITEDSQTKEGLNVKQLQMSNGVVTAADRYNRKEKGEQEVGYFKSKKMYATH
jgi:hypothetical protein